MFFYIKRLLKLLKNIMVISDLYLKQKKPYYERNPRTVNLVLGF